MLAIIAMAAVAALAGPACAHPLDRPASAAFTGAVVSADTFQLVMRADNGTLVRFPIDDPRTVPPGLVPGMRVTVRYDVIEGGHRLVGVKIASGPIEPGSTTDPPAEEVAPPSSPAAMESPQPASLPPPETIESTPVPAPQPRPAAVPMDSSVEPRSAVVTPAPEPPGRPEARARQPLPPTPALREGLALAAMLVVASLLLWGALRR